MNEIGDFLRARYDEEERVAPALHHEQCSSVVRRIVGGVLWAVGPCDCGYPARVLAEVDAKRRILEEASSMVWRDSLGYFLRLLALPYAGHPGYREEWRLTT